MTSYVTIQSNQFRSAFLRLDGTSVSTRVDAGQGTVNCQTYPGTYETLKLIPIPDQGPGVFAIGSTVFDNVFLYMDGRNVNGNVGPGQGKVKVQYGHFGWEHFRFIPQPDGTIAIESAEFPGVYLRMEGSNPPSKTSAGYGTVNCQGVNASYEKFIVLPAGFKTA